MTTLTPTEREILRHLSTTEPMTSEKLIEKTDILNILPFIEDLLARHLVATQPIRVSGRFTGQRGYILTPAGADLCEVMERERKGEHPAVRLEAVPPPAHIRELTALQEEPLARLAAQATREHGEPSRISPDEDLSWMTRYSPPEELFRNPVDRVFARKPSILARIKRWFWSAAA